MFYYLWTAIFADGTKIHQPSDDRYSKHDDTAEYNPSAFRDILDKQQESELIGFELKSVDGLHVCFLNMQSHSFVIDSNRIWLERPGEELTDIKLIYFRTMESSNINPEPRVLAYNFGYAGKDVNSGKIVEKVITIYE